MFEIPWPPSVNRYWRNVKGRVLISKEGRQYRHQIRMMTLTNSLPRFGQDRIRVRIDVFPPDRRRRDLDNLFKAVLDSLQHAGCYDDDSQIDDLRITRGQVVKDGALRVAIESIQG